jgi:hypothetical protein
MILLRVATDCQQKRESPESIEIRGILVDYSYGLDIVFSLQVFSRLWGLIEPPVAATEVAVIERGLGQ